MASAVLDKIVLLYDDDAFVEVYAEPPGEASPAQPFLVGRRVAGREFLDAYLTHGSWSELFALVRDKAQGQSLLRFCQEHPSAQTRRRSLCALEVGEFHQKFFPKPPSTIFHMPNPPDPRFAWARQHGGPATFALTGVTHTLCTQRVVDCLCSYVTAPLEAYDCLICTSQAALRMVRAVTDHYADYLRDRHGGAPRLRLRLETIPLGVNTDKYLQATAAERAAERRALQIADDEIAVLFIGRLTHYAKAQPFALFRSLALAAELTGRKVHLILSGRAPMPVVLDFFREGARHFAPRVRLSIVDSTDPPRRATIWHCADIFTSLVDSIQETFGLAVVEAMSCGLPVVAADWDGYRDLVVSGETGYLVPTVMAPGATQQTTSRLVCGEITYEHFLAECSQGVAVDCVAAAEAFVGLIRDAGLRQQMGAAGRRRAVEQFSWSRIIKAYEQLWLELECERQAHAIRLHGTLPPERGPACYPAPERSFAGHPASWLNTGDVLQTAPEAAERLQHLLALHLTNHSAHCRSRDAVQLRAVLAAAERPCFMAQLDGMLRQSQLSPNAVRATLAWMLKYDLLRIVRRA